MKILSVLSSRAVTARHPHRSYAASPDELQASSAYAVTFVITAADAMSDRLVAYAIDARTGEGSYSIETSRDRLPELFAFVAGTLAEVATGVIKGPPGPPHPGGDPPFLIGPGPGRDHPAVAVATISHGVIDGIERLQVIQQ